MEKRIEDILKNASEIFAKYGYKKTTMQDIGNKLGMTKSNLYLYFDNKEDLYIKSVSYQLTKWKNAVKEIVEGFTSAEAKFEILCKKSFEYIHENTTLKDLAEQDTDIFVTNHDSDRFIDVNMQAQQILKDIINEGIENGEFRKVDTDNVAEYMFSTYMMFLIKMYSKKDRYTTAKLMDDTIDLLKNGLLIK